jgi:hypothetical protein
VVPSVNYINNKDHVYYDPDMKKFYWFSLKIY